MDADNDDKLEQARKTAQDISNMIKSGEDFDKQMKEEYYDGLVNKWIEESKIERKIDF